MPAETILISNQLLVAPFANHCFGANVAAVTPRSGLLITAAAA